MLYRSLVFRRVYLAVAEAGAEFVFDVAIGDDHFLFVYFNLLTPVMALSDRDQSSKNGRHSYRATQRTEEPKLRDVVAAASILVLSWKYSSELALAFTPVDDQYRPLFPAFTK